jgi:hypothetical protein
MKSKKTPTTLLSLALVFAAANWLPVLAADTPAKASADATNADTVLRQMSDKLSSAKSFSLKAIREIDGGLAGGDGLDGKARISVTVQRPDKLVATATIPGDVRRLYFDGKQVSLNDVQKKLYSTVPLATSLDKLPSELATIYGFVPPAADFIVSDLYQDLVWRAKTVEYRGTGIIKTGFLGLKSIRCHRVALTGTHADSEIWIGIDDLLPRRWTSTVKGKEGNVEIRLELSDWNLEAKTQDKDFVFSPGKDELQIPMMTQAEIAAAHQAAK